MPYVEINFTMPSVFWAILQQNRHLLNDLPAVPAALIEFWAKAKYGVALFLWLFSRRMGISELLSTSAHFGFGWRFGDIKRKRDCSIAF
jgi:hypothetical protein